MKGGRYSYRDKTSSRYSVILKIKFPETAGF